MKQIFQGDNYNKVLDLTLEWMEEHPTFIINFINGYFKTKYNKKLTVIEIDYKEL